MRKLTGTVAVMTGASTGSGATLTKGRAAAGAAVAMHYASDTEGAGRTVSEMTSHGGQAIVLQAEVARAADVQRMCEETTHVFGVVDVLVNNAGVLQCEPFEAMTEQECHREFDTNVLGPILAIQEALQHIPASGGSSTLSSIARGIRYRSRRSLRRPRGWSIC